MRLEGFDELMSAAMNRRQANASEGRPWRPDA
jgi:hypothetical protein